MIMDQPLINITFESRESNDISLSPNDLIARAVSNCLSIFILGKLYLTLCMTDHSAYWLSIGTSRGENSR